MEKKSIAIDMDNVMADAESLYLEWYESDYGVKFSKEQLRGKPEKEAFPDKSAVDCFLSAPGFFRALPVIPGSQQAIKQLMKYYEVYIVSAALEYPQSLTEKWEWLQEHFPFISWKKIVFCGDKNIITTDYMIDDKKSNLDCCKGQGLLYTACHNINENPGRYTRVNNWNEVLEVLKAEPHRQAQYS